MSERKVLETKHFTITTERVIHGSTIVPMRDILIAWPMIERPWIFSVIFVVAGMSMLKWGNVGVKVAGVALLGAAYGVHRVLTGRTLVLQMRSEGGRNPIFDVRNAQELGEVMGAINDVLEQRKTGQSQRLQNELDEMESAF